MEFRGRIVLYEMPGGSRTTLGGASIYLLFHSDILNFRLKNNVGRHRRSNFVVYVVWSA